MRDAAVTFAIRVLGAGLAFALQSFLARIMAVDAYGSYVMVWTWVLAAGSFASLGLADVAARLLPRYALRLRRGAIRGFFSFGVRATAVFSAACAVVGVVIALALPVAAEPRLIIIAVCAGLPFIAIEFFLEGIARAMGWFRLTTVTIYIARPIIMAGAVGLLWSLGFAMTALLVCAVLAGILLLSLGGLSLVMRQRLKRNAEDIPPTATPRFWMKQALPMFIVSALDDALAYADVVLVGLLLGPVQSAVYFVASRVLTLVHLVQYGFYFVAARRFSLSLAAQDPVQTRRGLWRETAVTSATTALALGMTLLAAPYLLQLFGEAYGQSLPLVWILSLAVLARAGGLQVTELMMVAGQVRALLAVNATALCLLAIGFAAIVPDWGLTGAAATLAVVMTVRTALLLAPRLWTAPRAGQRRLAVT